MLEFFFLCFSLTNNIVPTETKLVVTITQTLQHKLYPTE